MRIALTSYSLSLLRSILQESVVVLAVARDDPTDEVPHFDSPRLKSQQLQVDAQLRVRMDDFEETVFCNVSIFVCR